MPVSSLSVELTTDPRSYGYAPLIASGNDQGLADMLNAPRDGTNVPGNPTGDGGNADGTIVGNQRVIPVERLMNAFDKTEVLALPNQRQDMLFQLLAIMKDSGNSIRMTAGLRQWIGTDFPVGTSTGDAVRALFTRPLSRAEEILGVGTSVAHQRIAKVLRG